MQQCPGGVPGRPDHRETAVADRDDRTVLERSIDATRRLEGAGPDLGGLRGIGHPDRDRDAVPPRMDDHVSGPGGKRVLDALELGRVEQDRAAAIGAKRLGSPEMIGMVMRGDQVGDRPRGHADLAQRAMEGLATRRQRHPGIDQHPLAAAVEQVDVDDRRPRGQGQEDLEDPRRQLTRLGAGRLRGRGRRAGRVGSRAPGRSDGHS
jgi:hypothetical protein